MDIVGPNLAIVQQRVYCDQASILPMHQNGLAIIPEGFVYRSCLPKTNKNQKMQQPPIALSLFSNEIRL